MPVSSLALQLAQGASLNSNILSHKRHCESYLFTGREADEHDLESIHALGVNGLLQLSSLDHSLRAYEQVLFSDAVKGIDRTLLSADAHAELNKQIAEFLRILGPYLMEPPTGKVIEWLVRRFRINEFNVEDVLALFWPYHESPHFAKVLTILHIKKQSIWSFLLAFKSATQCVPRVSLVTQMLRNSDLSRFITALLPDAIKGGYAHRTLLAFNAASLHDFILRSKTLDEGTVAFLLPALLEPLQSYSSQAKTSPKDSILGSYILLAALSQKCHFAPKALKVIIGAMASCARRVTTQQFINAAVSICEPQDELDHFSDDTIKSMLRLSDIVTELQKATMWVGIEKLICPMLSGLEQRMNEEAAFSIVQSLVTSTNIPQSIVQQTITLLMRQTIAAQESSSALPAVHQLLSVIPQRHPVIFKNAGETLSLEGDDMKVLVEQLAISLSITYPGENPNSASGDNETIDLIVASTSAEDVVRVHAVKGLINTLSANPIASELDSVHSALLARVQDTSTEVLGALYAHPTLIIPVLLKNYDSFISHLTSSLCSSASKPARALLRTHLTFLASHFCPTVDSAVLSDLFHRIFFPFLMFSKPRQRTAEVVWEIISKSEKDDGIAKYELLGGCIDLWKGADDANLVEKMSSLNLALASQIAGNILISDHFCEHFDTLLQKLGDTNVHIRLMGYLITRSLLACLSGRNQIDAAPKVLQALNFEEVVGQGTPWRGVDNTTNVLLSDSLVKVVVLKPSSSSTILCLQTSIVAVILGIPPPMTVPIDWFAKSYSDINDCGAYPYVELMRAVYKLANSTPAPLSTSLLGTLFENLKDDSLAFLAGVWTNSDDNEIRIAALRHAEAFFEAYRPAERSVDFQSVLPSLFVTLQTTDPRVKEAAFACISQLVLLSEKPFSSLYGFDTIYGEGSDKLQFLDRDDYRKYIMALSEHKEYLASDSNYISLFHQQHLAGIKSNKRKEAEYKKRVLCYLLSHVNAISSLDAQLAILRAVRYVSDPVRAVSLLHAMQGLVKDPPSQDKLANTYGSGLEEFTSLVLSSFDQSVSDGLDDPDSPLWLTFIQSLEHGFRPGSPLSPRATLIKSLESGLFGSLSLDHKFEVCNVLLKAGIRDAQMYQDCKNLLVNVLNEVPLIIQLLTSLQPLTTIDTPRASKRPRLTESAEDSLSCLTLLSEILGTKSLPGSLDLVSRLLETLGLVIQYPSRTQADMSYLEQLLMSAVENAAEKIAEAPNLTPSAVRLDVLVELIRVANNPQTFHQALLLMASLSRLVPDSVLHNIMPVFTFMGSNVFHRDDSYSFKVVQKTIESIVPVMASSLKKAHTDRLALYIGSKDFLRIFTEATNHIPRHRRSKFFAHLVDVLGPQDFLAAVLMLLLEKVVNRMIRQNPEDIQGSLNLQISILQHYSPPMQLLVLVELLRESRRLIIRAQDPEDLTSTFLELMPDEETAGPSSAVFKRRAQALLLFVEHALKSLSPPLPVDSTSEDSGLSDLTALLVDIATPHGIPESEKNTDIVSQTARSCLTQAARMMAAADFVGTSLVMLESEEDRIEAAALDLLAEHLPSVSDKTRLEVTPTIEKILGSIRKIIPLHQEGRLPVSAFNALKIIITTSPPGQEKSLTDLIPMVLESIKSGKSTASAMAVLPSLINKVGPRVIPSFREIVTRCVLVLRQDGQDESVIDDETLNVFRALLNTIPTFWSAEELSQVVRLYLDRCASTRSVAIPTLVKTIAKQVPAKVLLPTLCEVWPSVRASQGGNHYRYIGYSHLLKRAMRNAPRHAVLEHLRSLFKVFLEEFEISSSQSDEAEDQTISSFLELVVKLNEATFRPLFRRLHDWAFLAETNHEDTRRITFCRVYVSLLDYFKELMTPYMSFMLPSFIDVLKGCTYSSTAEKTLWSIVIDCLTKTFAFDDGAFWRDEKLRQISPLLTEQVAACLRLNSPDGKSKLSSCLSAMTSCVNDEALLKSINLDLLMHTRSEDPRLRLFALTCSETLWRAHGGKLIGFSAETTSFIAECTEDENDNIVKQAHRLKDAVKSVAGNVGDR